MIPPTRLEALAVLAKLVEMSSTAAGSAAGPPRLPRGGPDRAVPLEHRRRGVPGRLVPPPLSLARGRRRPRNNPSSDSPRLTTAALGSHANRAALQLSVRHLTRGEVSLLRDWPNSEGWNPGLHDAAVFYDADPDGFFVGELDGQPVATVSGVAYGDSFGFVGLYICRPEHRGRGFGLWVFQEAMRYLGDRNVGLDGVVAQQDNYRKSGFHHCYDNVRYQAVGGGERVADVVPLSEVPFAEINAYDRAHFPAPRPEFLRGWIAIPGSAALARLRGGKLVGYGVIRPCVVGFKIGPLFADDPGVADELLRSLSPMPRASRSCSTFPTTAPTRTPLGSSPIRLAPRLPHRPDVHESAAAAARSGLRRDEPGTRLIATSSGSAPAP
ncbi:MAG: GNAT family N-acetyltransferase [Gemmataceae bacterium]